MCEMRNNEKDNDGCIRTMLPEILINHFDYFTIGCNRHMMVNN